MGKRDTTHISHPRYIKAPQRYVREKGGGLVQAPKDKRDALYGPLIQVAFPLLIIHVEFLLAVARLVELAADESDDELPLLVHDVLAAAGLDVDAVGVEEVLGHEGEFGQDGRVPLDHVFLTDEGRMSAVEKIGVRK